MKKFEKSYYRNDAYEEFGAPTDGVSMEPETKYGVITNVKLCRLLREPRDHSDVVRILSKGTKVEILSRSGRYSKVMSAGKTGYVHSEFCEEV